METHNLGEAHLQLHADNCSGQNKNRYKTYASNSQFCCIQHIYLFLADTRCNTWPGKSLWDCTAPSLSFMVVGDTKFAPDWCFGLFKRFFWKTAFGCLDDIVGVVARSAEVNHAQLVAKQNGEVLVPTYNWSEELQPHFNPLGVAVILRHYQLTSTTVALPL